MSNSNTTIRKAAILITTLDTRSADAILDKMRPEMAELVRQQIMELDDVPAEEQEAVMREFMQAGGHVPTAVADGIELDDSLARKLHSPHGYAEHSPATPPTPVPPFQWLSEITPAAIARQLVRQHPQVIAVVLAHLQPGQAADVIKRLAPRLQADVLRRVAELGTTDHEVLQDIERELETLLSDELRLVRHRPVGLATVSTILQAAGEDRHELLTNLSRHEQALVALLPEREEHRPSTPPPSNRPEDTEPKTTHVVPAETTRRSTPPPLSIDFDDLTRLGDNDWAVLIRTVDPQVVLLSLTGASEPMLRRITKQMSGADAKTFRRKLEQTGPLRLSDIEHAQQHIARLAGQLAAQGEIQLPERRSFAAAA